MRGCVRMAETVWLGKGGRKEGNLLVPHAPEETSLGLLVVQALAAGHVDGVAAALLGHQALERRAGAAAAAVDGLWGGVLLAVHFWRDLV